MKMSEYLLTDCDSREPCSLLILHVHTCQTRDIHIILGIQQTIYQVATSNIWVNLGLVFFTEVHTSKWKCFQFPPKFSFLFLFRCLDSETADLDESGSTGSPNLLKTQCFWAMKTTVVLRLERFLRIFPSSTKNGTERKNPCTCPQGRTNLQAIFKQRKNWNNPVFLYQLAKDFGLLKKWRNVGWISYVKLL